MIAGIEIVDGVDRGRGAEAARLVAQGSICATVDWPFPADDSEQTVPANVVAALSNALAACGSVAFRYDTALAGAVLQRPPAAASAVGRVLDIAGLGEDTFGLAIASDPVAIGALFAYGGWSYAAQTALVFEPTSDPEPALAALRGGLDWRRRPLPSGARLLFGPGHDGDFAVVAARDVQWLQRFTSALS